MYVSAHVLERDHRSDWLRQVYLVVTTVTKVQISSMQSLFIQEHYRIIKRTNKQSRYAAIVQ